MKTSHTTSKRRSRGRTAVSALKHYDADTGDPGVLDLRAPARTARIIAAICLTIASAGAGLVVWLDGDLSRVPPAAIETTGVAQGILLSQPYPMVVEPRSGGVSRVTLLKDSGAGQATQRVKELDGSSVRVEGQSLRHARRAMIEVFDARNIAPAKSFEATVAESLQRRPAGDVVIRGEVVRDTASAPMLLARDATGASRYYLLASESGGPLDAETLRAVRGLIEAPGRLERLGDLWILNIDPRRIRSGGGPG